MQGSAWQSLWGDVLIDKENHAPKWYHRQSLELNTRHQAVLPRGLHLESEYYGPSELEELKGKDDDSRKAEWMEHCS